MIIYYGLHVRAIVYIKFYHIRRSCRAKNLNLLLATMSLFYDCYMQHCGYLTLIATLCEHFVMLIVVVSCMRRLFSDQFQVIRHNM